MTVDLVGRCKEQAGPFVEIANRFEQVQGAACVHVEVEERIDQTGRDRHLRRKMEDPAHAATKIIMVTTETEIAQVQNALAAGANEYVMKPFTTEVIYEKLCLLGLAGGA